MVKKQTGSNKQGAKGPPESVMHAAVSKARRGSAAVPVAASSNNAASDGGDPFKRTLKVGDMVIYGLISMVVIAPMAIYGNVFQTSNGMPALAYIIGFLSVLFSVFSFGIMIQHFPSSGSIFTYATHVMGKGMGFLTGWLMLLQYLVTPTLMYIIAATALKAFVPGIPVWAWCLVFLAIVAAVSLRGMKATVTVNRIALVAQFIVLAWFLVAGIGYAATHHGFTATALFNPKEFKFDSMMSAVSLAVLSYVGFGCIATLTQEAKHERTGPPKAMMIMACMLVVLFALQCFVATAIDPSGDSFKSDAGNGFYAVAKIAGGPILSIACAIMVALAQGVFTALVSQTSVSLIIYTMANANCLPKKLGTLKKGTNLPLAATIFVTALSLVLIFVLQPLGMDTVAKVSNFGALATYTILNVCVFVFCWFQLKQRKNVFRHLIFPICGAAICGWILCSLDKIALIVGVIWIVIGIIYYFVIRYVLHKDINLADN